MIIPEEELRIANEVFGDPEYNDATLLLHCGSNGLFVGKIFLNRKRILSTGQELTFKKALSKVISMLAEDYGDVE